MREDPPFRTDLINAAMGAQRLSNAAVAKEGRHRTNDRFKNPQWLHTGRLYDSQKSCSGLDYGGVSQTKADSVEGHPLVIKDLKPLPFLDACDWSKAVMTA